MWPPHCILITTLSAVDCGDVVLHSNANGSIGAVTDTTEGATVNFQCEEGLFLSSGHNSTLIQCTNTSQWMPNPATLLCRPQEIITTATTNVDPATDTTSAALSSSTFNNDLVPSGTALKIACG